MSDRITQLRTDFDGELATAVTEADATALRDRWVGRKSGLLTAEMKTLGKLSPEELIADIKSGLYITDLIGFGVNGVTGDYSRGASGFWIQNGKLAWPVSGITVAGNLKDMFLNMTPAKDLQFKSATNAPTVRIEGMTVAGS